MKNLKKIFTIGAIVMAVGVTSVVGFAADSQTLDNFKKERLEIKKEFLNTQVLDGKMTREQADLIIKAIEENQKLCDGTRTKKMGKGRGHGAMRLQDGTCNIPAQ